MALPQSKLIYTAEEYLVFEREAVERHEYLDGEIYEMAGESLAHGDICTNLVRELSNQLRGTRCRALSKDMKVRSGPLLEASRSTKGLFSYPDVVVVCGEPQFYDARRDVLLNPNVIIEVLSPSTEAFDRGEKFLRYRTHLASLTDYLLVSQDKCLIEHYRRMNDRRWELIFVEEMESGVQIASIDCRLRLADVYDRVTFPDAPPEIPEAENEN
ncbi:MAG: hypothetical protein QOC96_632 [Acidobacteriota bacterium]|nr:hypothetical protein [Acidobacteriota bacterium]